VSDGHGAAQKGMRRPTVMIADDHTIVMEGLVSLLKDRFDIVAAVSDGTQLVDLAVSRRPDVIVTDISMPGLSGLDALRQLKAKRSETKVLVLTMHADPELATEAIRAGASGFVLKQAAGEELITAIAEALQGRVYLTPALTQGVLSRMSKPPGGPETRLTPRQREVLKLIAEGRRMKEIAAILHLSTRTVETHKYGMMQNLGVQSTAELVRYAVEHRLVTGSE
jgi:DNA-binding NarL/FixJ family response regulator